MIPFWKWIGHNIIAMREAAIHWFEARIALKRKKDEVEESERTFKSLITWINGEEFEETIRHIASARKAVEDTRRQLNSMRSYINTRLDKTTEFQDSVDQNLIHIKGLVTKLRNLLKSGSSNTFFIRHVMRIRRKRRNNTEEIV
jgi:hypothetical protein